MKEIKGKFKLVEGHAVAFDFDGVIHKYSKGWQDGSIYDEHNGDILDFILLLQIMKIPVFIHSTRESEQIKEWWDKKGFTMPCVIIDDDCKFYNNCDVVGITNRKLPAQLYIDDRAYCYTGQTTKQLLMDFTEAEGE